MKNLQDLITEITQLTTHIETNYPELYRSLGENPLTIPAINDPHIDKKAMEEYFDSLTQLLKHHVDTYNNKISSLT